MENLLENMVSHSDAMQAVCKELGPLIQSATSLLLCGETGSGMGFIAKMLHEASERAGKFLLIPGFALDEETVKQQFLGINETEGWLEEANAGTIFIKRISEAPLEVQHVLSHLLGNRSVDGTLRFARLGRTETIEVNVRFIFSMTGDVNMALQDGLLRRDTVEELRRRGKILHIPALHERQADILPIARKFIAKYNQEYQQQVTEIDPRAQEILLNYAWPGNVDELKQVIEQILAQAQGVTTITEEHLPNQIKTPDITGDKYSFKLKDDVKFLGNMVSALLRVQTENKKLTLKTDSIAEIVRIEDDTFSPPKFKYYTFKLKDGSRLNGNILDKKMMIATSFDPTYEITIQNMYSVYLI